MSRRKTLLVSLMIMLVVLAGASNGVNRSDKQINKPQFHGRQETVYGGLVDFIRKQKLVNYQSMTIGRAFDAYRHVKRKEWKEASSNSRKIIIDFIGWFDPSILGKNDIKNGVTGSGIDITFVVEPDGSFYVFMVSKIVSRADGTVSRTQSGDIKGILDKIYANKKIIF